MVVAVGGDAVFTADGQKQLPGHGVVAPLVDVAYHINQIGRPALRHQARAGRSAANLGAALDSAAHLLPERAQGAGGVGGGGKCGQVALGNAVFMQVAGQGNGGLIALILNVIGYVGARAVAGGRQQGQLIDHLDLRQCRFNVHANTVLFTVAADDQYLEVGQQRIGLNQKRTVLVAAVVDKRRDIVRQTQVRRLQHQIAGNVANAGRLKIAQHQPHAFQGQLGVAAAAEDQITLQGAIDHRAVNKEVAAPLVGRAENFQRRIGGYQLHGRGGVDRGVGVNELGHALAFQRNDCQGHGVRRDLGGLQGTLYASGQGAAVGSVQWGTDSGHGQHGHQAQKGACNGVGHGGAAP